MNEQPAESDPCRERPIRHIDRLTPGTSGRWLVTTQGSHHEWDLDVMTYMRIPGPASQSGPFAHDGQRMKITRVGDWPRIGATSLVYLEDPADPLRRELWRQSSRISAITELGAADSEKRPPP